MLPKGEKYYYHLYITSSSNIPSAVYCRENLELIAEGLKGIRAYVVAGAASLRKALVFSSPPFPGAVAPPPNDLEVT
jgi:hypothetical protein